MNSKIKILVILTIFTTLSFSQNINGTWKNGQDWVYTITQVKNKFIWTMSNQHYKEIASGKIIGKNKISVEWTNAKNSGSATGTLKMDSLGKVTTIMWSNGAVFVKW